MGGSPGSVLGAGVIGDIFKLEERGRAMGFFFAVSSKILSILVCLSDFDRFRLVCWDLV